MPLHLNLYHEIAQKKVERQRDPLKLGIYGLVLIGLCLAGFYIYRLAAVSMTRGELTRLKSRWEELSKQQDTAVARESELNESVALVENLQNSIDSRFLWAPFLQELGGLVPRNVQILRLSGDIVGEGGAGAQLKFSVEGIAAGDQPRTEAENLRVEIEKTFGKRYANAETTFRSLEDGTSLVKLEGQELDVANFTIAVTVDITGGPVADLPDARLSTAGPVKP